MYKQCWKFKWHFLVLEQSVCLSASYIANSQTEIILIIETRVDFCYLNPCEDPDYKKKQAGVRGSACNVLGISKNLVFKSQQI